MLLQTVVRKTVRVAQRIRTLRGRSSRLGGMGFLRK